MAEGLACLSLAWPHYHGSDLHAKISHTDSKKIGISCPTPKRTQYHSYILCQYLRVHCEIRRYNILFLFLAF